MVLRETVSILHKASKQREWCDVSEAAECIERMTLS